MAEFADTIPLRSNGEVERGDDPKAIWRPSLHEWLILLSLATISVMISLDGKYLLKNSLMEMGMLTPQYHSHHPRHNSKRTESP